MPIEFASELVVDRRRADRRRRRTEHRVDNAEEFHADQEQPEERRKVERRRQIDPTTCERDYSDQEIEFMRAMDDYKRRSARQFPTWSEVLEVLRSLGYRQIAEPSEIEM